MSKKKSRSSVKQTNNQKQSLVQSKKKNRLNEICEKLLVLSSDPAYDTQLWHYYVDTSAILLNARILSPMRKDLSNRSRWIGQFMSWLKENGANVDGASIAEFTGYDLGLKAERDFSENELILEIPRELIFSRYTAAPELNSLQHDPLIQQMPHIALAIALLIEKYKENSKWKPYINILPVTYNTILYVNPLRMMELKNSLILESALKMLRNIVRQYAYFHRVFQNGTDAVSALLRDVFFFDEYSWAVSTVMTRQNMIPSEDGSSMIHALIPMWDMCNHEEGKITTDFNPTSNRCECYAKRDFKKGDQIFISYGRRTNSEFFIHSGFVYPDNKNDGIKLRLGISKSDELQKERIELLEKLGVPSNGEFLLKTGSEPISDSLLAFLRVFSMRKVELAHWLRSDKVSDLKHMDCALETIVEENARKFLLNRLKLLIDKYPTTMEEDLKKLNTRLSKMDRLILQFRISERKILLNALDYVKQWMKA